MMRTHWRHGVVCAAVFLAACASSAPPADPPGVTTVRIDMAAASAAASRTSSGEASSGSAAGPAGPSADGGERVVVTASDWKGGLNAYLRVLSDVSCPPGAGPEAEEALTIIATPVALQALTGRRRVGQLDFVGGFHLKSPDKRFGGLSGIDVLDDGNLLAVSDRGDFVWIDLAPDGFTPVRGRIASMHDERGEPLLGAADGDAEGLAVNGGMALVSFERNHRVLAFDLGRCGGAARGAPIVFGPFGLALSDAFLDERIRVDANQGAESLGITNDWYMFTGLETRKEGLSPMSARPVEAAPEFSHRIGVDAPEMVGVDVIPDTKGERGVRVFSLHRSFSPLSTNAISINETDYHRYVDPANPSRQIDNEIDNRARYQFAETGWRRLAEMNVLLTIDNFEGIAAKQLPDGRVRLFLISDDNFSASQRTLLMVFDLAKPLR
jgi:hypothetical protein